MCLWTLQASNFPVVPRCPVLLFQTTHQLFCVFIFNLLYKKKTPVMLDDKCKLKISFLFITDLLGLTPSSSERLVCTCEDHPKSPTNSNFSGIGFFSQNTVSKTKNRENTFKIWCMFPNLPKVLYLQSYWLLQREDSPGLCIRYFRFNWQCAKPFPQNKLTTLDCEVKGYST